MTVLNMATCFFKARKEEGFPGKQILQGCMALLWVWDHVCSITFEAFCLLRTRHGTWWPSESRDGTAGHGHQEQGICCTKLFTGKTWLWKVKIKLPDNSFHGMYSQLYLNVGFAFLTRKHHRENPREMVPRWIGLSWKRLGMSRGATQRQRKGVLGWQGDRE